MNNYEINLAVTFYLLSSYDFHIWYGYFDENPLKYILEVIYRVVKFIMDYPVSILILHYYFGWSMGVQHFDFSWSANSDVYWFLILKQAGWCDFIYMCLWKIHNPGRSYVLSWRSKEMWWLWWTPLGIWRSIIASVKEKKITRGKISMNEFVLQLGIALTAFIIFKYLI